MRQMSWRLRVFIAAQVAIPLLVLLIRIGTGEVKGYGWGWQMYAW